jgi:two-component sensor histidine kinase/integral membrane sensor domain MASE1
MIDPMAVGAQAPLKTRESWLSALCLALAYLLGAELGNLLSFKPSAFSAFWPPSGIFMTWLLISDRRSWPLLVAAGIAGNVCSDLINGRLLAVSLGFSLGNSLEALTGAFLCRRILGGPPSLRKPKDISVFTSVAVFVAAPLSATIGSAVVAIGLRGGPYWGTCLTWWSGDAVGMLIFAPLCLSAAQAWRRRAERRAVAVPELRRAVFACLTVLVSTAACLYVFLPSSGVVPTMVFLILPLTAWVAIEFGPVASTAFSCLLSLLAVGCSSLGRGAFAISEHDTRTLVFSLQLFLGTTAFMGLILAAGRRESRDDLRALASTETELRRSLAERELLFRELEHRVKNNLNVIDSLLSLECARLKGEEARRPLLEAQSRVRSMALVYRRLYSDDAMGGVKIGPYLVDLARDLVATYAVGKAEVEVDDRSEGLMLDLKRAVPLGLILNELLTNALKYASVPGKQLSAAVSVRRLGEGFSVEVSDDGPGFPPGFSIETSTGLGFQILRLLSSQMGASVEAGRSGAGGARVLLTLPAVPQA